MKIAQLAHLKKMVQAAKRAGYRSITISGSEPTCYDGLAPLATYIDKLGLDVLIGTNGASFASASYLKLFNHIKHLVIKISFHSHVKKTFEFLTDTKGSYEKVIAALDNISAHFNKLHRKNDFRKWLIVNIVINRYNYSQLSRMISFLNARGIRSVIFANLSPAERIYANSDLTIGLQEMLPHLLKAVASAKQKGMFYLINRLPICLLTPEHNTFVPYEAGAGFKAPLCKQCSFENTCYGISCTNFIHQRMPKPPLTRSRYEL